MKKSVMEKWTEALRSGKYKQGKRALRPTKNTFCCLGVLCNLHAQEHPKFAATQVDPHIYDRESGVLSEKVMKWAGMKTKNGTIQSTSECLAELNDDGESFKKIAKIIEKHYKEL